MRIADIMKEIRKTNEEHGFSSKGREIFCEKMLLIVSEISEALEEFRDGKGLTEIYYDDKNQYVPPKPEGIPVEIADAVIRILDWCEHNEIDLEHALRLKMDFNKTRPYRHGKTI